jgi:ubiquinone/menaquinone biosynthesis C-methylase UbiE
MTRDDTDVAADDAAGSRWEEFARRDAQYYIDPTLGPGADVETFLEGGRSVVDQAVEWVGPLPAPARALEIGCGIGRDTVHLARHFAQVDGVDVSATMVRSAKERGVPSNVRLHVGSGRDLGGFDDRSFDFVFSHLVFQHIADEAIVASYVREIARVLAAGGVAVTQFDTRPVSRLVELVQRLPDPVLPRSRRRGIRRHRRSAAHLRDLGRDAGLTLEAERDQDTAEHWFRWRLAEAGRPGAPRG